jgi:hypothetical protein
MPRGIEAFANVVLVTRDGTKLEAHASHLIVSCTTLAALPELFENATKSHPVELKEPFSSYETRTVVDFLACIYARSGSGKVPDDSRRLDVISLAHALDASFLDGVRDALPSFVETVNIQDINDIIEAASLCGWDDVKNAGISQLIWLLEKPLDVVHPHRTLALEPYYRTASHFEDGHPENATYSTETMATRPFEFSNELVSTHVHLDSMAVAQRIVDVCSPRTVTNVLQAFVSAKRLHALHDMGLHRAPLTHERLKYHDFVTDNVNDFIPCIDRNVPSRMIYGEIGDTYADYFDMHPTCSIEGDASTKEMVIMAVFEIAALEIGTYRTSMQFTVGPVRVSIRGELVENGIASFSFAGQCESNRVEVSYTLVVPGGNLEYRHDRPAVATTAACTGKCIVAPGGQGEAADVNVRVDVSSGGPNVPVICTIHTCREFVK